MNKIQKALTIASANLLALGATAFADMNIREGHQDPSGKSNQLGESQLRAIEASHLEVYAACKWGHAAFDPVKVDSELLSPEVAALHAAME